MVKIDKFIFLVEFVILNIIEDNKIPIILGRPMLATAHAKVDVYGKNLTLEVGGEEITFNANKLIVPTEKGSGCVVNHVQDQDEFDLDKFLDGVKIQGAPLRNNDSFPIENFDVFIDFEESGHGIGMDDGTGHHEINSMDVIPP